MAVQLHPAAEELIGRLELRPHPEGGWFRETWRGEAGPGRRAEGTAIYFLLAGGQVSRLHRLDADEVWHLYRGGPLRLHCLPPVGEHRQVVLADGDTPGSLHQLVVPAGTWFGAELEDPAGFCLAGCTMAPGFSDEGFELGRRHQLLDLFPEHAAVIERLTPTE